MRMEQVFTLEDLAKVNQMTVSKTVPEQDQESDEHDVTIASPAILGHMRRVLENPVDENMPEKLHDNPDAPRFWLKLVATTGEHLGTFEVMDCIVGIRREWRYDKKFWLYLESLQLPLHTWTS